MSVIAIIGAGAMGSGIARRLAGHGCTIPTLMDGRSAATRARAAAAGMVETDLAGIGQADMILSIVPPANAGDVIETLAPLFAGGAAPLFCDANANSPETKQAQAARVAQLGGQMVDGGIIGPPPSPTCASPRLYVCGDGAKTIAGLNRHGIDTRVLDGPLGAAAALKMCYAGINKGVIALVTAQLLAAQRHGASADLLAELSHSHGQLMQTMQGAIPRMYPKAWRWHPEMAEIAEFLHVDDPAAARIWAAIGDFYVDRATANEQDAELGSLNKLIG